MAGMSDLFGKFLIRSAKGLYTKYNFPSIRTDGRFLRKGAFTAANCHARAS